MNPERPTGPWSFVMLTAVVSGLVVPVFAQTVEQTP